MPDPTTNDFNLHLQKIEDLFVDPDSNPFENPQLSISGIQTILNELEIKQLDVPLSMAIYLPAEEISPGLVERTKEALQRYCAFQASNLDIEVRNTQKSGRRAFRMGLVGSFICILLAGTGYYLYAVSGNTALGFLGALFGSLFSLASWVIVWNPLDMLIYGWRPIRREANKYRNIARADVRILPET